MDRSQLKRELSDSVSASDDSTGGKRTRRGGSTDKSDIYLEDVNAHFDSQPGCSQNTLEYQMSESSNDTYEVTVKENENVHTIKCTLNSGSQNWDKHASCCNNNHEVSRFSEGRSEDQEDTILENDLECKNSPRHLWRNTSLIQDADTAILPSANTDLVFDVLAKHRTDANQLHIAAASVIDSSVEHPENNNIQILKQDQTNTEPVPGTSKSDPEAAQPSTSTQQDELYKIAQSILSELTEIQPDAKVNVRDVFLLLEKHSMNDDRVNTVLGILLQNSHSTRNRHQSVSDLSEDLFSKALLLRAKFPEQDPSLIYELLEKFEGQDNWLDKVCCSLEQKQKESCERPGLLRDDSVIDDPVLQNDPVFLDMKKVAKMFPNKDRNEIYALVEAHYYEQDRVLFVIEELLKTERNSQSQGDGNNLSQSSITTYETSSLLPSSAEYLGNLQADFECLRDIFPDCDPNYLYNRLESSNGTPDYVKAVAAEMLEKRNYPKLKDVLDKQTNEAQKYYLHNMKFEVEDFLSKFPNPDTTFGDEATELKENYINHARIQLSHDFSEFKSKYIFKVFFQHKQHFMPTFQELEMTRINILARVVKPQKILKDPKRIKNVPIIYPQIPDEYFFYELWFTRNEHKVQEYFRNKETERKLKLEVARARKELFECNCCYDDECLFEDMRACTDGHLFCCKCIAQFVKTEFGEGKTHFMCLTGICEHEIPLNVLKEVLPSAMFSKVLRKMQEEEVRQAGIPDLVECPFCSFATIMPDPNDRIFRCLNPECLKDSCRLCQEANHIPLKCAEVEQKSEMKMRTFIEKRVTESILRKCHKCGKHFIKETGCNKMTCVCGATSCYVCRQPDIDYRHFAKNGCLEKNMNKLHEKEMTEAAKQARLEYLRDHPEAASITLKHDPLKSLKANERPEWKDTPDVFVYGTPHFDYDNDHDYDHDDDDSDDTDYDNNIEIKESSSSSSSDVDVVINASHSFEYGW